MVVIIIVMWFECNPTVAGMFMSPHSPHSGTPSCTPPVVLVARSVVGTPPRDQQVLVISTPYRDRPRLSWTLAFPRATAALIFMAGMHHADAGMRAPSAPARGESQP